MLALRVSYLTGRMYSARFQDGDLKGEPEWPPHPSRLFSALTAAWGEGGGEEDLRSALEWLEQQRAPRILAGAHSVRKSVQAFVPVNDFRSLPEDRPRKGRTFPSATLTDPDVYFVWDAEPHGEVVDKLNQILLRTSSLGHSASLVSVEIAGEVNPGELTEWVPESAEGERMRIPYPGRLKELEERHRLFEKSGSKIHRPTAGRSTLYSTPQAKVSDPAQGIFDRMIILKRVTGPKAGLVSTLSLTGALRGAILKNSMQPPPEYISGHAPGSTPERPVPSERPHIAAVPLPFVDANYANGELMGLAVLLPKRLTREERQVCWAAVEAVEELKTVWGCWDVAIIDAEEQRTALRPGSWTRKSTVWSTVTPFVFDRYPKDPFGPEAERIVREALTRVGLPEPCAVDLHYNPWHRGVPKASAFPPAPARPGKPQRYHCHVRVRFAEEVQGPMVAGAGRFYGYGFFRALRDEEAQ